MLIQVIPFNQKYSDANEESESCIPSVKLYNNTVCL